MSVLCYIIRHGFTDISPRPEGWLPVPLNALGRAQATDAAEFIKQLKVQPTYAVSSDLARAVETCEIAAKILKLKVARPIPKLRAYSDKHETPEAFEKRCEFAFDTILSEAKSKNVIPLIVCHRSNTAWVGKKFSGVQQELDYRQASLVWEGGVVIVDENAARPIYRVLVDNPHANVVPCDGTSISGFVIAEDNAPPRECGNCKWMEDGHCDNPVVTADDEIGIRYGRKRNKEGKWLVEPSDCCNSFQNKVSIKGGT